MWSMLTGRRMSVPIIRGIAIDFGYTSEYLDESRAEQRTVNAMLTFIMLPDSMNTQNDTTAINMGAAQI